jgi:hypothetical protein
MGLELMNSKAVHQIQRQILSSAFLRTQQKFPPSSLRIFVAFAEKLNFNKLKAIV